MVYSDRESDNDCSIDNEKQVAKAAETVKTYGKKKLSLKKKANKFVFFSIVLNPRKLHVFNIG